MVLTLIQCMIIQTKNNISKGNRKFKPLDYYSQETSTKYYLLPFKFHRINEGKEVIVNEVGDFLIVDSGTSERIITRNIDKVNDTELYQDLEANFIISEQQIPKLLEVLVTRYRTKKSFLDYFTNLHIFVITLRCEHTCHYCQVSRVTQDKAAFDMSKRDIDAGIELMMQSPSPEVTMEFQGGEALLAFDNIIYAIEKTKKQAKQQGKTVTYVICTNLAPLNEEVLAYCKENNILISTSLDGPEFIHNSNRHKPKSNSYQIAIDGIKRCREYLGEDSVSALLTTSKLSLDYPIEIVDEYFSLGFRSIFLRSISPYGFATHNAKKNKYESQHFLDFYKKALNRILEYNLSGEFYREDYTSILLKKMLTPFPVGYVDLQSPAGMVNNVIVFNYDGSVYATDESRMLAEMNDKTFLLGKLNANTYKEIFYSEKVYKVSEASVNESLAGCSECAFQCYCGADPVYHHATQNNMYGHRPTSGFCEKNMEMIRYIFELMDSNKEIEQIFRSWVTGRT